MAQPHLPAAVAQVDGSRRGQRVEPALAEDLAGMGDRSLGSRGVSGAPAQQTGQHLAPLVRGHQLGAVPGVTRP